MVTNYQSLTLITLQSISQDNYVQLQNHFFEMNRDIMGMADYDFYIHLFYTISNTTYTIMFMTNAHVHELRCVQ